MKLSVLIFLVLFLCCTAEAQRKKNELKIYSGVENKYSDSHQVYFKQDSTVWVSLCAHHPPGCSNYINAGKWKSTKNGIVIEIKEYKKKTRLSNLGGTYYKVVKAECEFFIKDTAVNDTTQIFETTAKYLKSEGFDLEKDGDESGKPNKLRAILMSKYIISTFSWKSSLLVLNND